MFQPVNTVYYVAAIPGLKKKQTINRSFNYDWRYIQLPTDGETPSAGNICIKMKRWCYCALTGARQRHLCWAGYNGGGRGGIQWPASGDGNQIMNTFYILTHLIFSTAQGEFLSGSRRLISLFHVNAAERDGAGAPEHAQIHTHRRTIIFTHK